LRTGQIPEKSATGFNIPCPEVCSPFKIVPEEKQAVNHVTHVTSAKGAQGNRIMKFYRKMPTMPLKMKIPLFGISRLVVTSHLSVFTTFIDETLRCPPGKAFFSRHFPQTSVFGKKSLRFHPIK
jgi:hypothetical protein